ncbi:reverse transcriptase domain-containing protein [Tanacetum coccineum]
MFKQLHINIYLADALILILKYQKMLKDLLSNKEKLLELANTPLNENCLAVILKKLPEKLGDPGKFLILCSFSELNCKALADLGASINLMPLSVWKKLGLSEFISTRMTLELANRLVCTPARIARDIFVLVGRFTFLANFVIVDYESDPRVPLILGRPFLRTARALIDVHGEELILCDGDGRLILNMKHGTSSYSNKHQIKSINMIDIYNISYKDYLEDLFANEKITNQLSGNLTFSSEPNTLTSDLTSPEVKDDIFDLEGDIVLIEKLLNLDSTKDLPPSPNVNPLSGSTTSSSPSLTTSEISDYSLEEFADELALIESFPPGNNNMTLEVVIREIEYLLNRDPLAENSPNNDLIYTIPEMFTDEHTLNYSSPPRYDDADDDLFDLKTDNDEWGKYFMMIHLTLRKIKSKFLNSWLMNLIPLDQDKVFNPGILVYENLYEVTNRVTLDKNVKKISLSNASLILEDFNPPLSDHELPFHIEIPGSGTLLSFSSENEEKVFNPGILISKGVHSLLPELSHRDSKAFKVINIFESPMEIFPCSYGEDIRVLDVPYLSTEPILNPRHIDEFDLNDETSLSEYDEEEQNVLYFNDLFPFNIICPGDLKSKKGNDDNDIDTIQSSRDNEITHGSNMLFETSHDKIIKTFRMGSFVINLKVNIVIWTYYINELLFYLIMNLYVPFGIPFDPKRYYKDGDFVIMLRRPRSIRHMALPPHEQRHPFLRYKGLQYSYTDIIDFELRLAKIYQREVHRVQVFDFERLPDLMAEGLSARMLMEHKDAQGMSLFTSRAWRRLFDIRGSLRQFILALGLQTDEEMQTAGFGTYWADSTRQIPEKGDLRDYWIGISYAGDFFGIAPSYTAIQDPILKLCHRLIACSIAGRSQAPEKVTMTDLFYLRGMDVDSFVARLAEHFRLLTAEILGGLTVIALELLIIDMAELVRLQICEQLDDTWAWVAMGPERQLNAAAGAPKVARDAPVIDEGGQANSVPGQAPPPAAARTMPQKIARLEEDVHEIRGMLAEQHEVISAMARNFSRFITWTTTILARMMDMACVTYTSYSETPREYTRRMRRRTGKASTSTAQQDPQQPDL